MNWSELARPEPVMPGTELYKRIMESPKWVAQEKINGWRCLFEYTGNSWKATSRHGKDIAGEFSNEAGKSFFDIKKQCVIDGELKDGILHAFDIVSCDGIDVRLNPLSCRLMMLGGIIYGIDGIRKVRMRTDDKDEFYHRCIDERSEGLVLKSLRGQYPPNGGALWLKVKP